MNTVIHKHVFNNTDHVQSFAIPVGADILSVRNQRGVLTLWEAHNPETKETEARTFQLMFTGIETANHQACLFVGTVQMDDGCVIHVFETSPARRNGITRP